VTEPIRVLLVEDNDVYREALEFLLGRRDDVVVAGAVADGSAAASTCATLGADVVVIDYRLPDLDGREVVTEVRERCPGAGMVFLSASTGEEEREAARIAHIALVGKDEGVEALVAAVREAAERKRARGPDD
jgi:DNA-binding NarL/FixJ family response regulator